MIRMEREYLIGIVILLILIFMYIITVYRKEGFYTTINNHAKFNEYNKNRFNEIGYALNVTDTLDAMKASDTINVSGAKKKLRNLGPDIRGIVGNIESTTDAKGKRVERIDTPYSVPNAELSPVLKSIRMCEKVVTAKCSAFDDPSFSNTCGLCMDIGTNSMADKSVGGLLLLPKEKKYAKDNQKGNFLPNYIPTVGTCPVGYFVATKDECLRLEKQLQCQKSSTFNSPDGCSQCYGDSSYSIVDAKYDADLLRGSGSLYITGLGVLEYNEVGQNNKGVVNLSKMTDPYIINLMGGEMSTINLYLKKAIIPVPYSETTIYNIDDMVIFDRYIYTMVEGANAPGYAPNRPGDTLWTKEMPQSEYVAPLPNYLAGYLSGNTSDDSSFTFDMFRLIQTDTLSGRKPRAIGSMNMKNPSGSDDVEVTKMGPIYGKKEMKLVMKAPFTFVDPFSQEASQCAGSPFVTKPESARLLASDSCYKKGSGPGKYGMACLQAMFLNNGCTELGKGYPKDNNTMTEVMYNLDGKPLDLQGISDFVYSKAVTTSTGLSSDGKQLSIKKWSEASVFCTGVAITSPCDIGDKEFGPLTVDCLEYLWDNSGENKKLGTTYNIMSAASSLFNSGKTDRFCTKAGSMSPRYDNGNDNLAAIAYWQTKGGVNEVKSIMANIHYDANSDLVPEESKKEKLMQCYGIVPNQRPSYTNKFQPDNSLQTVLKPPLARTVKKAKSVITEGLQAWYDGSDPLDNGSQQSNGSTLASWKDKSGRKYHSTSVVGSPTLSKNGVVFDGSSYYKLPDGAIPFGDSSYSIYIVAMTGYDTPNVYGSIFGGGVAGGNQNLRVMTTMNPGAAIYTSWWGNDIANGTTTKNVPFLYSTLYESRGAQAIYFNGNKVHNGNPSARGQPAGPNYIGYNSANEKMNGTISEIIFFSVSHSQSQQQKIEGYLAWKWGLQGNLPATHPFKSVKPTPPAPFKITTVSG